jgi:SAM-dependent methyltransferase
VSAALVDGADVPLAAYRDAAAWAGGPQRVYDRLAGAALARLPDRLVGLRAVDVGAGTGAVSRELARRGADVLAIDRSPSMLAELRRQTSGRIPTIVGDIRRLALADDTYDLVVAAFVINHLADAAQGVGELARVTRRGGHVVATTFGADDHPIKAVVDDVLVGYGFVHPPWYRALKDKWMPLIATPPALHAVGERGGLTGVAVNSIEVDLSDLPIDGVLDYRLGLAHIAPYVAGLDPETRKSLRNDVLTAARDLPPFRLPMLVLNGRPSGESPPDAHPPRGARR